MLYLSVKFDEKDNGNVDEAVMTVPMLVPNFVYSWFQRPRKIDLFFDTGFGYRNQENHPS